MKSISTILLLAIAVSVLYPLFWTITSSIRDSTLFFQNPWRLPERLDFSVYAKVWTDHFIKYALFNSIRISVLTVCLSLLITLPAAYAISRMQWRFSELALAFFLMGLMIPGHSTIIPLYLSLVPIIEIVGPKYAIIIPYVAGTLPISIFILTNFMRTIPTRLEEAAVIDGCSVPKVFYKIVLPVSLPAVATVSIFNFLGVWNELMLALVFLSKNTDQTLPLSMLRFSGRFGVQWSETLATVSIAIIPSISVYVILQDRLVKGMTAGSLKG